MLLAGCTAKRTASPIVVPVQTTATTRTVHHVALETAHATLPQQSVRHTTPDSSSHLETDAAVSEAHINQDGTLSHWLENKASPIPVTVPITRDTIQVESIKEIPVPFPEPYEVERDFTWWEAMCLKFAPWAFGLLIIAIGFIVRRTLIKIARTFL